MMVMMIMAIMTMMISTTITITIIIPAGGWKGSSNKCCNGFCNLFCKKSPVIIAAISATTGSIFVIQAFYTAVWVACPVGHAR